MQEVFNFYLQISVFMIISPTLKNIEYIGFLLKRGEVIAFPTETIYGLGADATKDQAVSKIFSLKSRPSFNPLIVHCASLEEAQRYGIFNQRALDLAAHFWPAPLTLILSKREDSSISPLVTAGLSTIALRVPNHRIIQDLLKILPFPLAAPSANISGRLSPTLAAHVEGMFGPDLPILEGDACKHGLESTIIDMSASIPRLLRLGSLPKEHLEKMLNQPLEVCVQTKIGDAPLSPGQLLRHYAPLHSVRLNATQVEEGEALLAFGATPPKGKECITLNLSSSGNLEEAARNFYAMLHTLDNLENITGIAVQPIPKKGLGLALNDRLQRTQVKDTFV